MKSIPELSSDTLDRLRSAVQWVDGEHLEYTGRKSATKGGVISIQGGVFTVRRVIWRHVNGPIPDGHYVVGQCDFEGCLHPEHLSIRDAPNGRQDPLSDEEVRDIRRRYANNKTTYQELAREYDVSESHIGKICRYEIRVEAGPDDDKLMRDIDMKGHARMNPDIAYRSAEHREDGTLPIPPLSRKEVEDQILSRTSKTDEGCLIFRGKEESEGHATVTIDGLTYLAHRVVQESLNEHIPVGHHVYHKCGNKRCVNPSHLEESSPEDHAKSLSDEEVLEIRQAYENQTVSYADLAEEYGVTRSYIGKICRGEVRSSVRVEPR